MVAKINADANAVLKMPEIQERFKQLAVVRMGGSAEEMDRYYRKELTLWAQVVRDAKIERK